MAKALPSANTPAVDEDGRFSTAWLRFFSGFVSQSSAVESVEVGPAPFTYTAPQDGHALLMGGNVSLVTLRRGRTAVISPNTGFIPVAQGDTLTIGYSVRPALTFIPG